MIETGTRNYDLAGQIIGLAMEVHGVLGSGYLEKVYENALCLELEKSKLPFERQRSLNVVYKGQVVGDYVADILVNDSLLIELKAVHNLVSAHEVQLVNYLTATGIEEGLLLNFGGKSLTFKKRTRTFNPTQKKFR